MPATLKSRLPEISAEIRVRVGHAISEAADDIVEAARERVPTDSEDLYQAIHKENVGPGMYSVVAGDEDEVFYGHLVEFGHSGKTGEVPPRPFLVPAAEMMRVQISSRVTAILRGL